MSQAVEFFKKVSEDSVLKSVVAGAVEKAGSKDDEVLAVAKIAKEAGFDVSADELKAFVVSALKQAGELADSELENVAGGVGDLVINTGDINVTGIVLNVPSVVGEAVGAITGAAGALDTVSDIAGGAGIPIPIVPSIVSGW